MPELSNPSAGVLVRLDRERQLVFDANTFAAFEEKTSKFFLDIVATLLETLTPYMGAAAAVNPLAVLRKVSMVDIRALIWAAIHDYSPNGDPRWPLTLNQVGRLITLQNLPDILTAVFQGQMTAMPSEVEVGESSGPTANGLQPAGPVIVTPLKEENGGGDSGLPAATT